MNPPLTICLRGGASATTVTSAGSGCYLRSLTRFQDQRIARKQMRAGPQTERDHVGKAPNTTSLAFTSRHDAVSSQRPPLELTASQMANEIAVTDSTRWTTPALIAAPHRVTCHPPVTERV
jgi:hypothetical protein